MTDQNKPEDAIPEEEAPEESVDESAEPEPTEGVVEESTEEAAAEEAAAEAAPAQTEPVAGATAAASTSTSGPEEPPYIDDPVSKWWIGLIIAVFALIFVVVVLFGRGGFLSDLFESDDATPEPTIEATAEPEPTDAEESLSLIHI